MAKVSGELGDRLADIITDYVTSHVRDGLDLDDLQCSLAVVIDILETENEDDLTLEGGIDAHYDHIPELRDRLLAAL